MITEANFTAFYFILLAAGKSKVALIYWKTIYDNHLFKSLFLVTLMQMKNERYWELIYYVSEKVSFMTVQYIYNMSRVHCAIKYKGIFKPLTVDLQSYRYFEICCDIKAMKPKPFIWLLITWQNWENIVVSVYINIIQTRFVHLPRNRGQTEYNGLRDGWSLFWTLSRLALILRRWNERAWNFMNGKIKSAPFGLSIHFHHHTPFGSQRRKACSICCQ